MFILYPLMYVLYVYISACGCVCVYIHFGMYRKKPTLFGHLTQLLIRISSCT